MAVRTSVFELVLILPSGELMGRMFFGDGSLEIAVFFLNK